MIHISTHNTKLGNISSISLLPIVTCRNSIPCIQNCYAVNIMRRFKHVKENWTLNTSTYYKSSVRYFSLLSNYLHENNPSYFRYHIGGDIPNTNYILGMVKIAEEFKDINFMCFTKQFDIVKDIDIKNLSIILSMWPYIKNPCIKGKRAWIRGDPRIPINSYICKDLCINCLHCWNKKGNDIILRGH